MIERPDCLVAALRYARRGWSVFPLNGKHPFPGTHGFKDATTDPSIIRRWWKTWPDANVAISCSSLHGPIVVDCDGPNAIALVESLVFSDTREATSRENRRHYYFDPPATDQRIARMIKVRPELDILGDGGYVIAPPSIHPETGKPYTWRNNRACVPFPRPFLKIIASRQEKKNADPLPNVIDEGQRDTLLTSLAGSMRRRGASYDAILAALREENANRVRPPLSDGQLKKIAKSIAGKPPAGVGEHFTDLGNARRFVAQHQDDVRSVSLARRPWLIWDGPRWTTDDTGEVERRAKATIRSLYVEAAHAPDAEVRDAILKHAAKSERASAVRALLELSATEPEIALTADTLDSDPWLFNVENGTIDLRTGELRPHRRKDLITKLVPVEYRPNAKALRWRSFLKEIMDGDAELIDYVQRAIGYTMTGDTREECLFFCYGHGGNGKTKFFEVIRAVMGDYAQQADFNTFLSRRGEGPRNDLARMRGARLVTASEGDMEKGFDTTVLKQLTGGDTVTARRLYEEAFEFRPQHKLWLAANHKPIVKEQTEGFWRRMKLVPFNVIIPKEQRDRELEQKLMVELPGILNWAIEGCMRWQQSGLPEPKAIRRATESYRDENDILGEFLDHHCVIGNGAWTATTALYQKFSDWWLATRGPRSTPISMGWFGRLLSERPQLKQVKRNAIRGWKGIAIRMEQRT